MGFIAFVFMSLTPAWGTNYMAWLDPFPGGIGVTPALIYYLASGLMLSYLYFASGTEGPTMMFVCWAALLVVTRLFVETIKKVSASHDVSNPCP
jgi:hypothetical protein